MVPFSCVFIHPPVEKVPVASYIYYSDDTQALVNGLKEVKKISTTALAMTNHLFCQCLVCVVVFC